MRVKAVKQFRDIHTKEIYQEGQEFFITQERYIELNNAPAAPLVVFVSSEDALDNDPADTNTDAGLPKDEKTAVDETPKTEEQSGEKDSIPPKKEKEVEEIKKPKVTPKKRKPKK